MGNEIEVRKPRSIAIPNADVQDILNWKIQQYKELNIPIDVLSDYIFKGVNEIEEKKIQLQNYKKMIDNEIQELILHDKKVKTECAKFMSENGIDKLTGIEISSITITKEKLGTHKRIEIKEFVCDMSRNEINDFLVTQNMGSYKKSNSTEITLGSEAFIKINKRKQKKVL
mgnify:CR=1 FL=1